MRVLDILGRRWALRVLWELRDEPLSFRTLRERCDDVSPSVLNERVAELKDLGVLESSDEGYGLTPAGEQLGRILLSLHKWAESNAR
jgi:DNA-binding HxlR family transcriptional regulator